MNIKNRLTVQFGLLSALLFFIAFMAVYLLSEKYREDEFYTRLASHSRNIAKILIEVDEIDEFLLYRIEQDNPVRLPDEVIRIYNHRNELIFRLDDEDKLSPDTNLLNRIRLDSVIQYREGEREYLGLLFAARYDRFVILASAVDVYGNRKIDNLRNVIFIVFGISVLIVFLMARLFAEQAMHPVQALIREVDAITPSDLDKRLLGAEGNDEIAMVAKAFNKMLERVESAFRTQKNFIANASHEMRTPLTAISGQLDVLLLKVRSPEEYRHTLESVVDDVKNLNRMANRLLLLAQTESDAPKSEFAICRLDEVMWQCVSEIQKRTKEYLIQVTISEGMDDACDFEVFGNEGLLRSLIINLIENGCKYSDTHAVRVSMKKMAGSIQLSFEDEGIGIPKSELSGVFQPFFRGSNVSSHPGHGIGLSLVKRITDMHEGSIVLDSVQGKGTTVVVRLPLAGGTE